VTASAPQASQDETLRRLSREEAEYVIDCAHELADDQSLGTSRRAIHARQAALLEVVCCTTFPMTKVVALSMPSLSPWTDIRLTSEVGVSHWFLNQRSIEAINRWKRLAALEGAYSSMWVFHSLMDGREPLSKRAGCRDLVDAAREASLEGPERVSPSSIRRALRLPWAAHS